VTTDFADGAWHRLHPATPLLRGGLAFIALIGVLAVNLRDRIFELVLGNDDIYTGPGGEFEADAIDFIVAQELVVVALAIGVGVLLLLVAGFYFSWRMHTFRITDEVVEVRSGLLFRTNRKGRLDRIQGINIGRPFIPRLFGAAKLEISVAGSDGNVQLAYLSGRDADALRREILTLASGVRRAIPDSGAAPGAGDAEALHGEALHGEAPHAEALHGQAGSVAQLLDDRVAEFLAPELDVEPTAPQSVVRIHPGRLIGSTVLSDTTLIFLGLLVGLAVTIGVTGEFALVFAMLPGFIGLGGFLLARITRSLRYSIAATPDGVRVGFGLLSTTNETLPPGRVHSVRVSQPLLWRGAGWWQIAVNRASRSSQDGAAGQQQTTILPVGNLEDVRTVLALLLPDTATAETGPLIDAGLLSRGMPDDGYRTSPRRARVLRWFSQRRNGFAMSDGVLLLRTGAIWRSLTIVPYPRMQSVIVRQGPLLRALRLAEFGVHTVAGPITPTVGALDVHDAMQLFDAVAEAAVRSAQTDRTHRWGAA
jgi:putative membrane protein